jgi:SagB-type dehydrogenase family enzyme
LRTTGTKSQQRAPAPVISARLSSRARLQMHSNGAIVASYDTHTAGLGTFGTVAAACAGELRTGLPLSSLTPGSGNIDKETDLLLRRLAGLGLLDYPVGRTADSADELAVIEPQVAGYWPQTPQLGDGDTLVLSRFAFMRRRGNEMVLESARSSALFRIRDPKLMSVLWMLSTPQRIGELRGQDGFPGIELLALLVDCDIAVKPENASANPRLAEGDHALALWDFHDLLYHTRSTEGRHANPIGGIYPHGGVIPPLPALRPSWPGEQIDLRTFLAPNPDALLPVAKLLRERHSTRNYDDLRPITLAELSQFLDGTARVLPRPGGVGEPGESGPLEKTYRPYPCAGAAYELEVYLAISNCEGLDPGFYHYDAGAHALVRIEVPAKELKAMLARGASAMGVHTPPQALITIAARFGRISWKYGAIAYSLILKDAGILTQSLYLMASGMGLGGCAIGLSNIEQFEKMTGIGYQTEGPVAVFALGREPAPKVSG